MLVISTEFEAIWRDKGYKTTENIFAQKNGNFDTKIAFSKLFARDKTEGAREPIISATLNTFIPCYGYD